MRQKQKANFWRELCQSARTGRLKEEVWQYPRAQVELIVRAAAPQREEATPATGEIQAHPRFTGLYKALKQQRRRGPYLEISKHRAGVYLRGLKKYRRIQRRKGKKENEY